MGRMNHELNKLTLDVPQSVELIVNVLLMLLMHLRIAKIEWW